MESERMSIGLLVLSVAIGFNVGTYKAIAQDAVPSKEQIAALLVRAKAGDVESQWLVGTDYEDSHDYMNAAIWLRKAAASGNVLAQDHLAYLYDQGNGVPQDDGQAAFWMSKAAEQGDSWAEKSLGTLYSKGQGVPQDSKFAGFWWHKAAAQGDKDARQQLAESGDIGAQQQVAMDFVAEGKYIEAAFWLQMAAERGDPDSQYHLAGLYMRGLGVSENDETAVAWYRKAAEQGYADAQYQLGSCYLRGIGIQRDPKIAVFWLRKAADRRNADAKFLLALLIAVSALCLVLLTAVMYTAIRLRKKLIGFSKRFLPHTSRSRQLTVLLLVGGWCSACCLIQVLNKRTMLHPVNAAVTALLWMIPGLIFGAVCMWWLSHPLSENGPVPTPARPEPANPPKESARERTEIVARAQTRGYRWGKFQGWSQLIAGGIAFLIYGAAGNIIGLIFAALSMYCGYGLIKRYRYGAILFLVGAGIAGLVAIGVDAFALIHVFIDPESGGQRLGAGLAYTIVVALWWLVPAVFYYRTRWTEFAKGVF
jgi:TPR repeat protein